MSTVIDLVRRFGKKPHPRRFAVAPSSRDVVLEAELIPQVNQVALDEAIRAVVPTFSGLSIHRNMLVLHFSVNAPDADLNQAKQIALKHDPQLLSPSQVTTAQQVLRLQELEGELKDVPKTEMLEKRLELLDLRRTLGI